jgi:hypothetical protein
MSIGSHERRLRRLERKRNLHDEGPTLEQLVRESYLPDEGEQDRPEAPPDKPESPPEPAVAARVEATLRPPDQPDPPSPREVRPRYTKTRRPGPNDVLTWQELLKVPWIEGDDHKTKD